MASNVLTGKGHTGAGQYRVTNASAGVLAALLALLFTADCAADSFRCGRKVVRNGDAQSRVLAACGQPQFKDTAQETVWSGSSQKNVRVQRWIYKPSSRKLERVVLFYKGKVIAVKTGGR